MLAADVIAMHGPRSVGTVALLMKESCIFVILCFFWFVVLYLGVASPCCNERLLLCFFSCFVGSSFFYLGVAVRRKPLLSASCMLRFAVRRARCVYVRRVIWWVVHAHAYGGLSVSSLSFLLLPSCSLFLSLSLSLFLSLSSLSHSEPTE